MYLFQDRKLQPSTIDGYRSAIADKLGNGPINISKDENLTRLLDSFHRDRSKGRRGIPSWNISLVLHQLTKVPFKPIKRGLLEALDLQDSFSPKGRRGIPSWNLSLVLHQLTKAHFEPIKEASLKHLTFKTVFLLALGSGKRKSEIHAWKTEILDTNLTGQRCPCTHHPVFCPRISWPMRVQTVWPQWLFQPWPQLWIDPSSLTGPSVQSEHYTTVWTGPPAEQGVGLCLL